MQDQISKFIDFMADHNLPPASASDIKADGKWRDFQIAGDAKGKLKGYYVLKIDGDFVSGACGDRRSGETYQYRGRPDRKLTDEERREWAKRREAESKAKADETKKRQADVAAKAKARWGKAKAAAHSYLERKGLDGEGTRIDGDTLLIPMYADGKLWGVQAIDSDGGKLFAAGGRKKGCYCPIATADEIKDKIYICEGYATAGSVRAATGGVTIAAFDAGNLKPVAQDMRKKYPQALIIIAGDNDTSQTGQTKAQEAADAVDGIAVWPDEVDKDYNDLHKDYGLEYVKNSLAAKVEDRTRRQGPNPPPDVVSEPSGPPLWDNVPMSVYEADMTIERRTVEDWRSLLITNGEGKLVKSSLKNMMLFLEHHEDYQGVFKLNDFQKEIFVTACPKWEAPGAFKVHRVEDNDISQTAASLERYGIAPSTDAVFKAIQVVAEVNKFHPAREYFNSLKWDGIKRLDKWLAYYMGAEGDDSDYLSFIGKKWMTAAVKRVFEAGCKFDHILVMEGKQGRGKSTAFEYLATFGRDQKETYFTDNIKLSDIQNKDTILLLQGSIIVELAELAGFRKQDDEEIKGWITTKEDRCRKPYGKTVTHFPRQFVLCGTTNNHDYLKDPTGNRRYWPFKSNAVDLEAIKNDREQLWAEAMQCYRDGLYIGPTAEEAEMALKAQEKRRSYDAWEDDVMGAIKDMGPMQADMGFNIKQIFKFMGLGIKDQDAKNTRRIAGILQQAGYDSVSKWVDGRTQRVWVKAHD
jgi:putative DNA primase/helicase